MQPDSCSTAPPHSGHAPARLSSPSSDLLIIVPASPVVCHSRKCSSAMPTASAHESTLPPCAHAGLGQRMPRGCLMIASGSTPARRETEINRDRASDCEDAHPPDLPICVKTSHRPCSSALMVTYRLPQPVLIFAVRPTGTAGRGLGSISPRRTSASSAVADLPVLPVERTWLSLDPSR